MIVGNARFTVITPECIRLEYSNCGVFVDARSLFAVDRGAVCTEFELAQTATTTVIDTGTIRLVYVPDGMSFGPNNLTATIRHGAGLVAWAPGQKNEQNLGGTLECLDCVDCAVDVGEGLLARDGWYLLDDSTGPLLTDTWVESRPANSGVDWYLFGYGLDYKAALRAMTRIGGAVPMPRKYALGAWYSRYWPHDSREFRTIVTEYAQHGFPLDVVVLDMDWHRDGWTGWSWNRELLPDAEELLAFLHDQDLFVALNVHPADGVGPHEDMYEDFMRDMGRDPSGGDVVPFDAGSKAYLDLLWAHTHTPREREGADFWWLDWQQERYTRSIPDLPVLPWLNRYYYERSDRGDRRGLILSRWGGWGDHRHPIHFSGDAFTSFEVLAFEVPFTATAGNVGCFFWSHDIGGHQGARNEEAYVRWVQFGAVSATLRSHAARDEALDRRPWTYSAAAEAAMRRAFRLRSILFPYIYSAVSQCARESVPLVRPMYLEYPDRDEAYRSPGQYLFGGALLAAPITSPGLGPRGTAAQTVWFPDDGWYDWFTGTRYDAGEVTVMSPLDEFPLFAKGGMPIPLQPYTPRMTTTALTELIIRCYPGHRGRFELYEDDGLTNGYVAGRCALTELTYERAGRVATVRVGGTHGSYAGQVRSRSYVIELPRLHRPTAVHLDGAPTTAEYDGDTHTVRVRIPVRSIRHAVTVGVEAEEVRDVHRVPRCGDSLPVATLAELGAHATSA